MKQQNKTILNNRNEAEIEIYFDEIEPERSCNHLILGALFIKSDNKERILGKLMDFRFNGIITEDKEAIIYKMSNTEIHFNEIRKSRSSNRQISISKKWLGFFVNDNLTYSAILYIDLKKLDTSFFGDNNINANIYNKFFRTIINYGLKCFFSSYDKINVKNIFYDKKGELERHSFFNNFNFDKIVYESGENIELKGKIIFIDSDHKAEKDYPSESHFIQLIDLILGAVRQNVFCVSNDELKKEISRILRPELNKLNEEYWSLNYLKVSFFPKNKIKSITDLEKNETYERKDEFYSLMDMQLKMPAQKETLDRWF